MSGGLIPVGCALIAALTALLIALQNRKWIKQDRDADRLEKERLQQVDAQRVTTRKAAERTFDLLPSDCSLWMKTVSQSQPDLVAMISSCFRAVEPIRRWAYVLPLPWRLRIDGMASFLAHSGDAQAGMQLHRDIVDLLNGYERPSPLSDDFAWAWTVYLAALLGTPRYEHDPATRGLAKRFTAVVLLSDQGALDIVSDQGLVEMEFSLESSRDLLATVTGREDFGLPPLAQRASGLERQSGD